MPSNITVTATTNSISVNETTNNVTVTSTPTTVTVGSATSVSNTEIRSAISVTDTGGDGSLGYNSTTGVFTYTGPSQAEANVRIAAAPTQVIGHFSNVEPIKLEANGRISIDSSALFSGKTTDDLTEGSSNLYFTNARARQSLSTTGGILTYSNVSGEIGLTSANVRSQISASSPISYNSSTGVISTSMIAITGTASTRRADSIVTSQGAASNIHGIYPSGNQYTYPHDYVLNFDDSTGSLSATVPAKTFTAVGTDIDGTRGVVLACIGNSNGTPIVAHYDHANANVSVPCGVLMSGGGVGSQSVTVCHQGYVTLDKTFFNIDTVEDGELLYPISTGGGTPRGGYANVPASGATIVGPIGRKIDTGSTLTTIYVDTNQPYFDTANLTVTTKSFNDGNVTGGPVVIGADVVKNITAQTGTTAGISIGGTGSSPTIGINPGAFTNTVSMLATDKFLISDGGATGSIFPQYINLANLDNQFAQFSSNAQVVTHIGANPLTVGGNLNVSGNIIATGNIDYENVTDLFVTDQKITLNANAATDANVEIIANRPQSTSVKIKWNEDTNRWTFTNDGTTFYNLAASTSDVAEGTNLYFTTPRANTAFDDRLADKTTDNLTEGSTNQYFTNARSNIAFDDRLADKTTSNLAEGTNLYYTTARANSAIADYTGTISTGNTISGTTITATTSAKTNVLSPQSGEDVSFTDTNKHVFAPKKQNISYLSGNINQKGTIVDRIFDGTGISSEEVTTSSEFQTAVGSTNIGGAFASKSGIWTAGVRGADGAAVFTAGSNVVQLTGLQSLITNSAPFFYLGIYGFDPRTNVDLSTIFQANMALRLGRAGLDMEGPFPKGTVIKSVANSAADGSANVIMSNNAERTTTFTITAATDTIGVFHTVRDDATGDIRALNGVEINKGSSGLSQNQTNFQSVSADNHLAEGFAENGANYFQRFSTTSLTPIDANIVPSMITKSNVSSTQYHDIIEMNSEKGFYRFPDTVLIGDRSGFQSRNNDIDSITGFGLNVQWSGLGDTNKYGSTAQPAMTFQSFSDNALLGTSGFEDKAGPRIMLSSFKGNKNDPWTNVYPRQGQELGKYAWWSHSGETQNGSTTVPPAAITAIANNDWDTDANISLDVIHYAQGRTANDQLAFLKHADGDTIVGAHSSKKIKLGTAGAISSDVRTSSDLTAELLTVDTTETELYNRLQLYSRTTAEINALSSPQAGQVLYNSTLNQVCVYNGTEWRKISDSTM